MLHRLMLSLFDTLMFSGTLMFFGVGMGPTDTEKNETGALINIGNFGTAEGEKDILASGKFWEAIMSGDQTKISQVLGPLMSTVNKQGQQEKKTASEFGNRGGGTNAGMQMVGDKTRSTIDSMIAELTGKGASTLGATGSNLLSTGLAGHEAGFNAATKLQEESMAKWNDIFKSAADVAVPILMG